MADDLTEQTRITGTMHADGGFTTGDPNNPTMIPTEALALAAKQTTLGGSQQMPAMADLTAAPTQENFNALLAALRTAGLMKDS